jgi:hypothetical protein
MERAGGTHALEERVRILDVRRVAGVDRGDVVGAFHFDVSPLLL